MDIILKRKFFNMVNQSFNSFISTVGNEMQFAPFIIRVVPLLFGLGSFAHNSNFTY